MSIGPLSNRTFTKYFTRLRSSPNIFCSVRSICSSENHLLGSCHVPGDGHSKLLKKKELREVGRAGMQKDNYSGVLGLIDTK